LSFDYVIPRRQPTQCLFQIHGYFSFLYSYHFLLIMTTLFLFFSFFARPDPTEGGGKSIAGTTGTTTTAIDGAVADEPERFESERGTFEMISESENEGEQQQTPKANVVAPFVSRQPGKKFRHVLEKGLNYLNLKNWTDWICLNLSLGERGNLKYRRLMSGV
jgi:hypothetical protein